MSVTLNPSGAFPVGRGNAAAGAAAPRPAVSDLVNAVNGRDTAPRRRFHVLNGFMLGALAAAAAALATSFLVSSELLSAFALGACFAFAAGAVLLFSLVVYLSALHPARAGASGGALPSTGATVSGLWARLRRAPALQLDSHRDSRSRLRAVLRVRNNARRPLVVRAVRVRSPPGTRMAAAPAAGAAVRREVTVEFSGDRVELAEEIAPGAYASIGLFLLLARSHLSARAVRIEVEFGRADAGEAPLRRRLSTRLPR